RPLVEGSGREWIVCRQEQHARPPLVERSRYRRVIRNNVAPGDDSSLLACAFGCVGVRTELIIVARLRNLKVCSVAHEDGLHRVCRIHVEIKLQEISRSPARVMNRPRIVWTQEAPRFKACTIKIVARLFCVATELDCGIITYRVSRADRQGS